MKLATILLRRLLHIAATVVLVALLIFTLMHLLTGDPVLMLLGERPGLGTPDSLGAYFTWKPGAEKTDADRNCLSNIRPGGLDPADAALRLNRLIRESLHQRLSGVRLKDLGEAPGAHPLPEVVLKPA